MNAKKQFFPGCSHVGSLAGLVVLGAVLLFSCTGLTGLSSRRSAINQDSARRLYDGIPLLDEDFQGRVTFSRAFVLAEEGGNRFIRSRPKILWHCAELLCRDAL